MDDIGGGGWTTLGSAGSGARQFVSPSSVIADAVGHIYIADSANNRVVRVDDMTGKGWVTFGTKGSAVNQFDRPRGIALDQAGRIYVLDTGNDRVARIDGMTGKGWITFGSTGSGVNQFRVKAGTEGSGLGITVDAVGRIYVADATNSRIVRVDDMTGAGWITFGSRGTESNQFRDPQGIAVR